MQCSNLRSFALWDDCRIDFCSASLILLNDFSVLRPTTSSRLPTYWEHCLICLILLNELLSNFHFHFSALHLSPFDLTDRRIDSSKSIQNCNNPKYLKIIYLRSDMITDKTRVQFSLMDLRDLKSSMVSSRFFRDHFLALCFILL